MKTKKQNLLLKLFGVVPNFFKKATRKLGKKKTIALLLIILIVTGIWIFKSRKGQKEVETAIIQKGEVAEELILSGEIKAVNHAQLTFPASGKIVWINTKEGDRVKKGQALASLDKTTLNAAYQQALNNVRMYEADVDYIHDSLKNKDATETFSERDTRTTAEVAKDNAYDALRAAEYNLQNSTLVAPFAGLVTYVANPFSGINIVATQTQIELVDPATIYFEVSADQSEIVDIAQGQRAKVIIDSFPDQEFEGEVAFIGYTPQAGEVGTVYKIKVNFPNTDETAMPKIGMTGDVRFILSQKQDVFYLPPRFVHSDKKGKYINLSKKNDKNYIDVGIEGEERTEISGNVKEGDIVFE